MQKDLKNYHKIERSATEDIISPLIHQCHHRDQDSSLMPRRWTQKIKCILHDWYRWLQTQPSYHPKDQPTRERKIIEHKNINNKNNLFNRLLDCSRGELLLGNSSVVVFINTKNISDFKFCQIDKQNLPGKGLIIFEELSESFQKDSEFLEGEIVIIRLIAALVNISAVMEGSIDRRAAVKYFLQSQNISDPPGDLGQGEEPVVIHVQGSPQPPPPSQSSRGPGVRKVGVYLLPVDCFIWPHVQCQHQTGARTCADSDLM